MEEIVASMYVDDLISGGYKKEEVIGFKEIATKTFQDGEFTLHKWHTDCSIESHKNRHEAIEHQFTNQITTNQKEVKLKHLKMC